MRVDLSDKALGIEYDQERQATTESLQRALDMLTKRIASLTSDALQQAGVSELFVDTNTIIDALNTKKAEIEIMLNPPII